MENKVADKLVIVSRLGYGKELGLLSGRTTIGSAPDNDIQLEDKEISGFHAQLQVENDSFLLTDFDTETGTFLNGERIKQEIPIVTGDTIQIGSTQAVFLPADSILVKDQQLRADRGGARNELFRNISPRLKKTIAVCLLVLLAVLVKIALTPSGTKTTEPGKQVAANQTDAGDTATPADDAENQINKENTDAALPAKGLDQKGFSDSGAKSESGRREPVAGGKKETWPKSAAEIYFNTAGQFSEYRLWSPALENLYKVLNLNRDYPELLPEIERMQFEIKNQAVYEAGVGLIRAMQYEKGIARLNIITENSVYYDDAAQKIAATEAKIATEKKEIAQVENKYRLKKSLKSATKKRQRRPDVLKLALADYTGGNIPAALQKLDRALQTIDKENPQTMAQIKDLKKQIQYSDFLYRKGNKEYTTGQALAAFSTWTRLFEADQKIVPEKNSFFRLSAVEKMAREYGKRAFGAYSKDDLRTAYMLSEKALNIKADDPQSLNVQKKLAAKTKQFYEEGYILEAYNYEEALKKYNQIFKICGADTVYYKKAQARIGRR